MNKIKRSIKLLKAAFAVLFREKKLLLFPMIASTLALVVALFFLVPVVFYPTGDPVFSAAHWRALGDTFLQDASQKHHVPGSPVVVGKSGFALVVTSHWWVTPLFAALYFISMFIATFSNVAFYHEIMQALNGNAVSIRRGFRVAAARWRAVLLWSLFAGLVGYIINAIEQRVGFLGKIIMSFIGMAWSVACIFIIPTLVRDTETTNPVKLLRQSAGTLKRTWGELVVGFVGLELVFGLIFLTIFLGVGAVVVMGGYGHIHLPRVLGLWLMLAGIAGVVLALVVMSWISNLVNQVYRCALYIYATEGVVPESFDQELLDSAWKVK